MGRKKRKANAATSRIFCYYCERNFSSEQTLLSHQREKHLRCPQCAKRMISVSGLVIHAQQVHGVCVNAVPNAIPGRTSTAVDVVGMNGIPPAYFANSSAQPAPKNARTDIYSAGAYAAHRYYSAAPQGIPGPTLPAAHYYPPAVVAPPQARAPVHGPPTPLPIAMPPAVAQPQPAAATTTAAPVPQPVKISAPAKLSAPPVRFQSAAPGVAAARAPQASPNLASASPPAKARTPAPFELLSAPAPTAPSAGFQLISTKPPASDGAATSTASDKEPNKLSAPPVHVKAPAKLSVPPSRFAAVRDPNVSSPPVAASVPAEARTPAPFELPSTNASSSSAKVSAPSRFQPAASPAAAPSAPKASFEILHTKTGAGDNEAASFSKPAFEVLSTSTPSQQVPSKLSAAPVKPAFEVLSTSTPSKQQPSKLSAAPVLSLQSLPTEDHAPSSLTKPLNVPKPATSKAPFELISSMPAGLASAPAKLGFEVISSTPTPGGFEVLSTSAPSHQGPTKLFDAPVRSLGGTNGPPVRSLGGSNGPAGSSSVSSLPATSEKSKFEILSSPTPSQKQPSVLSATPVRFGAAPSNGTPSASVIAPQPAATKAPFELISKSPAGSSGTRFGAAPSNDAPSAPPTTKAPFELISTSPADSSAAPAAFEVVSVKAAPPPPTP